MYQWNNSTDIHSSQQDRFDILELFYCELYTYFACTWCARKALKTIIYWKLLVVKGRAQFQYGRVFSQDGPKDRTRNSWSLHFGDLPPEGSPTLNGQNPYCLLIVYPTTLPATPILILKVEPRFCPWLHTPSPSIIWNHSDYRTDIIISLVLCWAEEGEPIGLGCWESISCAHTGLYLTVLSGSNLTVPFFRRCVFVSSLNPTDTMCTMVNLLVFFFFLF